MPTWSVFPEALVWYRSGLNQDSDFITSARVELIILWKVAGAIFYYFSRYSILHFLCLSDPILPTNYIWAATWQNQQNECAPSEDSDQPGHPPSLIRVFAVRMKKDWVLSYPLSALRRLWSEWVDTQTDLSLRWAHSHFVGFDMRLLMYSFFSFKIWFAHN